MTAKAPDLRKRQILDAARGLLIKRGFQDIALDDVARAAKVAKGTLFLYYRDKNELFTAAFRDLVDQIGESLEGLERSGLTGLPLLRETIRSILAHFERNRDFMSQFGAGRFPGCRDSSSAALIGRMSRNLARVEHILRLCAGHGLVRVKDKEYAAINLFGLCRSAMNAKLFKGAKLSLEDETEKVLEFFLHGAGGRR